MIIGKTKTNQPVESSKQLEDAIEGAGAKTISGSFTEITSEELSKLNVGDIVVSSSGGSSEVGIVTDKNATFFMLQHSKNDMVSSYIYVNGSYNTTREYKFGTLLYKHEISISDAVIKIISPISKPCETLTDIEGIFNTMYNGYYVSIALGNGIIAGINVVGANINISYCDEAELKVLKETITDTITEDAVTPL